MLDPILEQKMDLIAEQIFGTYHDPEQISVTKESGVKLEKLTPHWIEYEVDSKGDPIAWVVVLPTSKELADKFLSKEITEKQLLDLTNSQDVYSAIYLCAAITIPKYQLQGLARKLFVKAINKIPKTPDYILFAWPIGDGGQAVAERVGEDLGRDIRIRCQD